MVATTKQTRNRRDGTLTIQDGTGSPNTLVVPIDDGDFSFTVRSEDHLVVRNRGALSHYAKGDDMEVEWSFTGKYVALRGPSASASAPTLYEAMTGTGNASSWTSTEACGGVFCFNILWNLTSPCPTGDEDELVTLGDCVLDEASFQEDVEANTISFSGKALITKPTAARS